MIYDRPINEVKENSPMYQNPSTAHPSTGNDTTKKNISVQSTNNKKKIYNKSEILKNLP